MMKERRIRRYFAAAVLLLSASLLYGGWQVQHNVGKAQVFEDGVREQMQRLNSILEDEAEGTLEGSQGSTDPELFIRACSEEL